MKRLHSLPLPSTKWTLSLSLSLSSSKKESLLIVKRRAMFFSELRLIAKRTFSTILPQNMPIEKLVKLTVNGNEIKVPDTSTIMQACQVGGVDIPRFCYHERLGIAGNCRMCLVQVNGGPKLVASCAAPIMPDMKIETDSALVKKGREGVMEFLLANHPLDCPICDQGGECDLQDQAMAFGSDRSRFQISLQDKRATEDKNFGPLIKTSMNRCIHCTRCVRFANEIAGVQELGTTGRGNDMEIGTFISKMIDSPLSGNIIDLCPVGALTSKPYAFVARPWELKRVDSIDVMDAVGTNIRIDSRGMEVMRILPRLNESINEEWMADKSRFSYDALRRQRLVQPLVRMPDNSLIPISWEDALVTVAENLNASRTLSITGVVGRFADLESIFALKSLFKSVNKSGSNLILDGCNNIPSSSSSSLIPIELSKELCFASKIIGIEEADAILLIGCNPKIDAPLLDARIRKSWLRKDLEIGLIGEEECKKNFTFDYHHFGIDYTAIEKATLMIKNAKRPMIIVGQDAIFNHPNAQNTLLSIQKLCKEAKDSLFQKDEWIGLNLLPTMASTVGALKMGVETRGIPMDSKFVYLLNADDFVDVQAIPKDAFVVYQGHHGDFGASIANLILPSAAYTEKESTFVNMEGRPQRTRPAIAPPGEAREDWTIIRAISEFVGPILPFDNVDELRMAIKEEYPHLVNIGTITPSTGIKDAIFNLKLAPTIISTAMPIPYTNQKDYYLTDCISRHSETMAKCSLAFTHNTIVNESSNIFE